MGIKSGGDFINHHRHQVNGFNSVQSSPLRGATIQDYPLGYKSSNASLSSSTRSLTRKKPVPTPRTILNVTSSAEQINVENEKNQKAEEISQLKDQSELNRRSDEVNMVELDKLILRYSQFVIDPNEPDDYCPVCVHHLDDSAPPSVPGKSIIPNSADDEHTLRKKEKELAAVVCLTACQHKVHVACLKRSTINNSNNGNGGMSKIGYISCPTCKAICGHCEGDMPSKGATMTYRIIAKGLPGYEDYHTIQITYNFPDTAALQGPEHPNPGQPLLFVGFPKTAFLPDTEQGEDTIYHLAKHTHI